MNEKHEDNLDRGWDIIEKVGEAIDQAGPHRQMVHCRHHGRVGIGRPVGVPGKEPDAGPVRAAPSAGSHRA
jgi:hypothetical protein